MLIEEKEVKKKMLKPIKINYDELQKDWIIKVNDIAYKVLRVSHSAYCVPYAFIKGKIFATQEKANNYICAGGIIISARSEVPVYGKHTAKIKG